MNRKLTRNTLTEIVARYHTRGELSRADSSAYKTILKNNWHDLFDALKPVKRWKPEEVEAVAGSYSTRTEWQNEHPTSYAAAIRLNILDKVGPPSRRSENRST